MEEGWDLCVFVTDLQIVRRLRVRGDLHIGGVILKLTESIEMRTNWSDHALWWPEQKRWLLRTRITLDQAGVFPNAELEFHRKHGEIHVQLPDMQERPVRVNFAQSVFGVMVSACRELGIRHPEELSLRRVPGRPGTAVATANVGSGTFGTLGSRFSSFRRSKSAKGSSQMEISAPVTNGNHSLLTRQTSQASSRSPYSEPVTASPVSMNSFLQLEGTELAHLVNSPWVSTRAAFAEKGLPRLRVLTDRAEVNEGWLDSSRSLMEQGVRPGGGSWEDQGCLQLRFKFHAFNDLNAKYDTVRINQIFEQLKWSVLSEELECSEEEALLLAALQLHIRLTSGDATPDSATIGRRFQLDAADNGRVAGTAPEDEKVADDDIDAALAELEASLMVDAVSLGPRGPPNSSLKKVPELAGFLKFFKPRKHTIRGFRRYYFVLKETQLTMFPDQGRSHSLETFSLLSSELASDVNAMTRKFGIRLLVPDPTAPSGQVQEMWLRCESKDQFAEWTAGLSLASRGKTLASRAEYEAEVKATTKQLELQAPKSQPRLTLDMAPPDMDPADFVPARYLKSRKPRWLLQRILERRANVSDKSRVEAKLDYIKICQRLPLYGVAHFVVQVFSDQSAMKLSELRKSSRVRELVGVAPNRLMRMELGSGQIVSTWRFEELECWSVNWDSLSVELQLSRPPHNLVLAPCSSSPAVSRQSLCKSLAEFIGGNVFLSLRKPEKSQELDEQLFHKLTACRELGNI